MKLMCVECGYEMDRDDVTGLEKEFVKLDYKTVTRYGKCPHCGGITLEKVAICSVCDEKYCESQVIGDACNSCVEKYKYDIDVCYRIGEKDTEKIEINCFLANMFDAEDINKILYVVLLASSKKNKIDCTPFISSDRDWFGERLVEEVKK